MNIIEICKTLANEERFRILSQLKQPEVYYPEMQTKPEEAKHGVCIGLIVKKSDFSQSTISGYMSMLERAGLVTSKRVGKMTYYRRNEENINNFIKQLDSNI